ncbi:unnamed protein product [Cercopithifilaria johnstoni]|uniref:Uncharacterized protein n=1 Tax=Cercopithifilaria johnstoni TaxID=2874296 RepID=A0A8J2LMW0_9BILA|nr:unnamed protein product [Cercopithifilaria johnstoni]
MVHDEQKGRTTSSEAAEKERLLKHEEAAKALGKPIYDDMKKRLPSKTRNVCVIAVSRSFHYIPMDELAAFANIQIFITDK